MKKILSLFLMLFAVVTFSAQAAGTESDPIVIAQAGVAVNGPKAASSTSDYTYYKYVAEQNGVVTVNASELGYVMGNITVGSTSVGLSAPVAVSTNDEVIIKMACQTDCSDKTFTVSIRDFAAGETKDLAIALNEGANTIKALVSPATAWYCINVPAGKEMTFAAANAYPSGKIIAGDDEVALAWDSNVNGYAATYANNTGADVMAYVYINANSSVCTATVTLADAAPAQTPITKLGAVEFNIENGAEVEAVDFVKVMFPNTDAEATDIVTVSAYVFEADENGNQVGAPLNMTSSEYTSTVADGISIRNVAFEAGKSYIVSVSTIAIRETGDNGHGGKTYAYSYPNAEEHDPISLSFSVKASSSVNFDITAVTMNWKGEQIAAGSEVEALSYMFAIDTDKTLSAGEGHIEFTDAEGNGIGVGSLAGNYLRFMSFGENGYTTPGVYTLTIPAGALVDAEGNKNNEFTATWTVVANEAGSFDIAAVVMNWKGEQIAAGSEVEALSYMFAIDTDKELTAGEGHIEFTDAEGNGIGVATLAGNYLRFTSFGENGYTTPGVYTLTIPAGALVDAEGNKNNEFTATWTVVANEAGSFDIAAVVMNWKGEQIAAGSEVEALSYMFAIDTDKELTAGEGHIEFTDAEGNGIGVATLAGNYLRFTSFGENGYTTPGVYTLTIPAGALVDAEGNKNNEFTATWTVVANEAGSFDIAAVVMNWKGEQIAAGSEVEALSYMFAIDTDKELTAGEGHIEFKDAEGNGIGVATLAGNYLRFTSFGENGYTTPGVYTLTIPAGALVDAEGNKNNEFTATWTVVANEAGSFDIAAVVMNWKGEQIAAGSEVEALSYMFAIDTDKELTAGEGHIEFTDAEGNGIGVATLAGNYLRFTSFGENGYTTPGVYTLTIPAGALVDAEGNKNNEFTATWTVVASGAASFAITSATNAGNESGAEVEVLSYMFEINSSRAIAGVGEGYISLTDAEGNEVGGHAYVYGYEEGANTVYARFAFDTEDHQLHTAGTYTLTIPAGALVDLEGNKNEAYTATWTVKEAAEAGSFDIAAVVMNWKGEQIASGSEVEALSYMFEIDTDKELTAGEGHIEFKDAEGNGIGVATLAGNYIRFTSFGENGYTTPGVYTLTIPAGALVDAEGNKNNEFTATWTVVANEAGTFDIAAVVMNWKGEQIVAGSEVEALSYMFAIDTDKELTAGEGHIEFTDAEGNGIGVATVMGNYLRFDSFGENGYTTPGVYTLTIPAGALVDAEGNKNNAYTTSWTVTGAEAGTFEIASATNANVEAGAEVEALSYMFTIETSAPVVAQGSGSVTLSDAEGNLVGGNAYLYGYEGEEGATTVYARFAFDTEDHLLHTPGVYTLNVPAGVFVSAAGDKNEAFSASWTVKDAESLIINDVVAEVDTVTVHNDFFGVNDVNYTATLKFNVPAEVKYVSCVQGITLTSEGEDTGVAFRLNNGMDTYFELNGTTAEVPFIDGMICATDDEAYEGDLRLDGTYVAEATLILYDENYNEIGVANYVGTLVLPFVELQKGTGINGIAADGMNAASVYDLNGRAVSKIQKAGIYVVNGKKVMVK